MHECVDMMDVLQKCTRAHFILSKVDIMITIQVC